MLCKKNKITDKFEPRAIKGVFLSYSTITKGYRILDLEKRTIFVNRNVSFYETVFPFKQKEKQINQPLIRDIDNTTNLDPTNPRQTETRLTEPTPTPSQNKRKEVYTQTTPQIPRRGGEVKRPKMYEDYVCYNANKSKFQ